MLGVTILIAALAGAGVVCLLWPTGAGPPVIKAVSFGPATVTLHLASPQKIQRLVISRPGRETALDLRLPSVPRQRLQVPFSWRPDVAYDLLLVSEQGKVSLQSQAPAATGRGLQVALIAPYDSHAATREQYVGRARDSYRAAVLRGSTTTCALILRSHLEAPGSVQGRVLLKGALRLDQGSLPADVHVKNTAQGQVMTFARRLSGTGEVHALIFRIKTGPGANHGLEAELCLDQAGAVRQYLRTVEFSVMHARQMAAKLRVLANRIPAGRTGLPEERAQAQTIYVRPPLFKTLTRWLGVRQASLPYWMPHTYQSLTLVNDSADTLSLLITAKVLAQDSDQTPRAFYPPDLFTGTMKDMSVVVSASLLPGEKARVAVPIFISSPPVPDSYRRRVIITPMASTTPLKTLESPLYVRSMNFNALLFTLAAVAASLAGLIVLAVFFKRLLAGMKIRWLVIIALFGSLSFVGVNIPLRVFGSLIHGVMGPFSGLVLGLFNDLLYFSLLVALVRLIPRPGVVALSSLVRYLLTVVITGGFQLTDFVYLGSSIVVQESALYLAGVTRLKEAFTWTWPKMTLLAALLAIGDAFLNASSLYLHMVVYRLYFADWYILLTVVVNGLIYTSLAVLIGKRFSDRLVWVEE